MKIWYRGVPGTEQILEVGYRWVSATEQILEVGYCWVPGTGQEKNFGYRWVPGIGKIFTYADPCLNSSAAITPGVSAVLSADRFWAPHTVRYQPYRGAPSGSTAQTPFIRKPIALFLRVSIKRIKTPKI